MTTPLIVPRPKQQTLKTEHGRTFEPAKWDGNNTSGFTPIGDLILIKPDKHVEKTAGGIILTDQDVDRKGTAVQSGVLVAAGDGAFVWSADRARRWEGVKPEAGQRVIFGRYEGNVYQGNDGEEYRIMADKCIAAIHTLKEEA